MTQQYTALGEKLFRRVLPNGLTVAVVPRPGFTKKLAYFVTDFGSIHTDFRLEGKEYHWCYSKHPDAKRIEDF